MVKVTDIEYTSQQLKAIKSQDKAVEDLMGMVEAGHGEIGIFGKAGCGKTHVSQIVLDRLIQMYPEKKRENLKIIAVTLAHTAKNVLQERMEKFETCNTSTFASSMHYTKKYDPVDGKVFYIPQVRKVWNKTKKKYDFKKPPIETADIILFDECSQLNDYDLAQFRSKVPNNAIVIFMGDIAQTPPIQNEETQAEMADQGRRNLSATFDIPHVQLTIPFRFEGDIQKITDVMHQNILNHINKNKDIDFKPFYKFHSHKNKDYRFITDKVEFFELYKKQFAQATHVNHCRFVCYKNVTIDYANKKFRKALIPDSYKSDYVIGDILIAKDNYAIKGLTQIYNAETYMVAEVKTHVGYMAKIDGLFAGVCRKFDKQSFLRDINIEYDIDEDRVTFSEFKYIAIRLGGVEHFIPVRVIKSDDDKIMSLINRGKVFKYYPKFSKYVAKGQYQDFTATFQYGFCISTYRTQGHTYDVSFVNAEDILNTNPIDDLAKMQSLYVACSRAKSKVYIYINKNRLS